MPGSSSSISTPQLTTDEPLVRSRGHSPCGYPSTESAGEADDQPHEADAEDRAGQGEAAWMAGVGLGKDVGGCQVEEDAGEKPEVEPEDLLRDGQYERDGGTRDGGEGVGDEEGQRAPAVVPVQRGDGVGVEPVGEVVAEHGDRDHGPDGAAGLEPGTDGQAVQQAVHDQRGGGEHAEAWGVNVARVLTFLTFVR